VSLIKIGNLSIIDNSFLSLIPDTIPKTVNSNNGSIEIDDDNDYYIVNGDENLNSFIGVSDKCFVVQWNTNRQINNNSNLKLYNNNNRKIKQGDISEFVFTDDNQVKEINFIPKNQNEKGFFTMTTIATQGQTEFVLPVVIRKSTSQIVVNINDFLITENYYALKNDHLLMKVNNNGKSQICTIIATIASFVTALNQNDRVDIAVIDKLSNLYNNNSNSDDNVDSKYLSSLDYIGRKIWKANVQYKLGDIRFTNKLPEGCYLECLQDGNSSSVEPDWIIGQVIIDNTTKWRIRSLSESTGGIEIGTIMPHLSTTVPEGWLACDSGLLVSRTTYSALWSWVQKNAPLVSESEWQSKSNTQSSVGFYSTGDGVSTFRLPKIVDFIRGGNIAGNYQSDAIRNITGTTNTSPTISNSSSGAFTQVVNSSQAGISGSTYDGYLAQFDASRVVPTADENRPKNISMIYCVKAYSITPKEVGMISASQYLGLKLWQPNTDYIVNDICFSSTNSELKYIKCIKNGLSGTIEPQWTIGQWVDDNTTQWQVCDLLTSSGSGNNISEGVELGTIIPFLVNNIPNGWLACDKGDLVNRDDYTDLWEWVQSNAPLVTDEEWIEKSNIQSSVGLFSLGDNNLTFRLPKIVDFIRGGSVAGSFQGDNSNSITQIEARALSQGTSDATGTWSMPTDGSWSSEIDTGDAGSASACQMKLRTNGIETRPKNITMIYCIKAVKNATVDKDLSNALEFDKAKMRKSLTYYHIGDIKFSNTLPSYAYLECIEEGTTDLKEPTWPTVIGQTIIDGSVTWVIRDLRQGNKAGNIVNVIDVGNTKAGLPALSGKLLTDIDSSSTIRNTVLFGDISKDNNPKCLEINGNKISLKSGTIISFANGWDDAKPKEHIKKVELETNTALINTSDYTIPKKYSNNLCIGGTPISSGDIVNYSNIMAFDGSSEAGAWRSNIDANSCINTAFIGYGFNTKKRIRKIKLVHDTINEYVTSVKIQYSDNGTSWTNVGDYSTTVGVNYIYVSPVGEHQYWRIMANSNAKNGNGTPVAWYVKEIEMYEAYQTNYIYADYDEKSDLISLKSTVNKIQKTSSTTKSKGFKQGYYTGNLCSNGLAISGGDYSGYPAGNAFMKQNSFWQCSQGDGTPIPQTNNAYIGYRFDSPKSIRKMIISNNQTNYWPCFTVQCSNDGVNWTNATKEIIMPDYGNTAIIGVFEISIPFMNKSYSYWRLLATKGLSLGRWVVDEIEMMEYVEIDLNNTIEYSNNLCISGTAISSGNYTGSINNNAFDNSITTIWKSENNSEYNTRYIGYDFGIEKTINKICINIVSFSNSVKVQYSNNATNWTDIGIYNVVNGQNELYIEKDIKARYWRIIGNSLTQTNGISNKVENFNVASVTMHNKIQAFYYTENVCVNGTPIGSPVAQPPAPQYLLNYAFDGNDTTLYCPSPQPLGACKDLYVGYSFNSTKKINRILLHQHSSLDGCVSSVKIQYSSDGNTWLDHVVIDGLTIGKNTFDFPTINTQYIRVLANSNTIISNENSAWKIYNIEMYELVFVNSNSMIFDSFNYSENLCVDGLVISSPPALYSSSINDNYFAKYAFDDNVNTSFAPLKGYGDGNCLGAWIGYNFKAIKSINRIELFQSLLSKHAISSVKIQYSYDGNTWIDSVAFNNLTIGKNTLNFPTINTQYIRILANSNTIELINGSVWKVVKIEMNQLLSTRNIITKDNILPIFSENLCVGGMAIASGSLSNDDAKEFAFNQTQEKIWRSEINTAFNTRYIGYDFGVNKHIRLIKCKLCFLTTTIKIQNSLNGIDWQDVLITNGTSSEDVVLFLPESRSARFWRIICNSNTRIDGTSVTNVHLSVANMRMFEICNDLNIYDSYKGITQYFNNGIFEEKSRVFIGEVVTDKNGYIVEMLSYKYGLNQIKALPAEQSDDVVTLGQFESLLSYNGYQILPNGLIMQWGTVTLPPNSSTVTVTFPIAFPSTCLQVIAGGESGLGTAPVCACDFTNTTCKIAQMAVVAINGTQKAHFIAFGY